MCASLYISISERVSRLPMVAHHSIYSSTHSPSSHNSSFKLGATCEAEGGYAWSSWLSPYFLCDA